MMFAIMIMAYVLSIYLGLENKVEYMKKYKDKSKNLSVSYFRQGLSIFESIACNFMKFKGFLINFFKETHQRETDYMSSSKANFLEIWVIPQVFSKSITVKWYNSPEEKSEPFLFNV